MKVISLLSVALIGLTVITIIGYADVDDKSADEPKSGLYTQSNAFLNPDDSIPSKEEYTDPLLY